MIPRYFYATRNFVQNKLSSSSQKEKNSDYFVVSLTSFPKRIDKVWLCIETILRQEIKPDELILWLYEGEFKYKKAIPKILLA